MFDKLSITAAVLGSALAFLMWRHCICAPIKIKFNYSVLSWIGPILLAFGIIMLSISAELSVGYFIADHAEALATWMSLVPFISLKIADILVQLLVNGILIPGLCALVSLIFGHMIKQMNFDYLRLYSVNVPKVIMSALTILICFRLLVVPYSVETEADYFAFARILTWTISVIGTWLGFGMGCESRVDERRKAEKSKDITRDIKLQFWTPIVFALMICVFVMLLSSGSQYGDIVLSFAKYFSYSFFIVSVIMIGFIRLLIIPPVALSNLFFDVVYKNYKNNKSIYGRYKRLRYIIKDRTLIIDDANYIYVGHEKNLYFRDKIHEDPIPLYGNRHPKIDDPKGIKELLDSINKDREKYIIECFDECVNELKKAKEKSL